MRVRSAKRFPVPVIQCRSCGFFRAATIPSSNSESAGTHSVMTTESYTENMLKSYVSRLELYNQLARNRHEYFRQKLRKNQYSLLEVGCGTAATAEEFGRLGVRFVGIDLDARVVGAARSRGIDARTQDLFAFRTDEQFDVITFSQVLEHVTEPAMFMKHIHDLLRPGGLAVCDVPNHDSLSSKLHKVLPIKSVRFGALEYSHHLFAYTRPVLQRLFDSVLTDVQVFTRNSIDPLWGQAVRWNTTPLWVYGVLSRALNAESLIIGIGQKRLTD